MKTTAPQTEPLTTIQIRKTDSRSLLKNTGIAILGILFCAGSLALAGETNNAAPAEAANNLVVNGGFESPGDGDNSAEGWNFKTALCSQEQKHGGKTSLKLSVQADDEKKQIEAQQGLDVGLFKAGDEVEFSLYAMSTAKLGAGSNPYARIIIQDSNWKSQGGVTVDLPREPAGEWKKLSGKVAVPANFNADSHVKIQIIVWVGAKPETAGAIYVDDVQVTTHPATKP